MKKLTVKQKLAIVNAVIAANAALLGEEPTIQATMLGRRCRVGPPRAGNSIRYQTVDAAVEAAIVAFGNATEYYRRNGQ